MDSPRIQRIFQASDKDADGYLDKEEFTGLLKKVNPDIGFVDAQVGLILDEVWTTFASHVAVKGLTFEGLRQIYLEGYADIARDYDTFIKAHNASDAIAIERVSGGRLGMAAVSRRRPALADASPDPSDQLDIFSALKTPLPAAGTPLVSPENDADSLAFALHLPGLVTQDDLDASGKRQQLLVALIDSMPENSSAHIESLIPTPAGLAIGITCSVPPGAIDSEEVEYFQAVMRVEPEQIFPESSFGQAQVVPADVRAAAGASAAAAAAVQTTAAAILAGASGRAALSFSVRLPDVDMKAFTMEKGAKFMAHLRSAMPTDSVARALHVTAATSSDSKEQHGVIVTVAASVPTSHISQARALIRKLHEDPGSIFNAKTFGPPWLVAASKPVTRRPALGVQVRILLDQPSSSSLDLPEEVDQNQKRQQQRQMTEDMARELERCLPEGSTAATVRCVEEEYSLQGPVPVVATLVAALPEGTPALEVDRIASGLAASHWIPTIIASNDKDNGRPTKVKTERIHVGAALDFNAGFGGDDDDELFFGTGKSLHSMPHSKGQQQQQQQRSPSPARALFGRLFGQRGAGNGNASPGPLPDSPASPPAAAIIAGYTRRPPSSGGSSGLAEAVEAISLGEEDEGGSDGSGSGSGSGSSSSPVAIVDTAEGPPISALVEGASPLKGQDVSAPPLISVVAYVSGGNDADFAAEDAEPININNNNSQRGKSIEMGDEQQAAVDAPLRGAMGQEVATHKHEQVTPSDKAKKSSGGGMWKSLKSALSPSKNKRLPVVDAAATEPLPAATTTITGTPGTGTGPTLTAPVAEEECSRALTPWEAQQRQNAKEWAVMDSHVSQILAQLQYILDTASASGDIADVSGVQHAATMLPPWARHAAHMEIGDALSQHGMFEEAGISFSEAASAWTDDPLARFRLGNMHFARHRYQESSRAYFEALKRCAEGDPLLVKVHINMGISLESIGRMEAAEREYSKAAELAPAHPRVHKLVGSARLALGDTPGAVTALKRALEINPDFVDAWADLGCAHAAQGDVGEAQRCLEEGLGIDSGHVEAHYNLGNVLQYRRHDLPAAVVHYDAVLAGVPDHWRSLLNKSVALARLGGLSKKREAAECLRRAYVELSSLSGMLAIEVDALKELMDSGADGDTLSQHVSVIEERARRAALRVQATGDPSSISATPSATATTSRSASVSAPLASAGQDGHTSTRNAQRLSTALSDTAASGVVPEKRHHQNRNRSPHPAAAPARAPNVMTQSYGLSPGRIIGRSNSGSLSSSPEKQEQQQQAREERAATWTPLLNIRQSDFGEDVRSRLADKGLEPVGILSSLDVPLLQNLQPCSCLSLGEIWAEAKAAEQAITHRGQNFTHRRSGGTGGATSSLKSKLIAIEQAEIVLHRLALRHSAPHLERTVMTALLGRVLPMLDHAGTGSVDLALVLCIITAVVDAPVRQRLDLSYRLLMWRTRDLTDNGREDPVTRSQVVELLSTLKMVFEREHSIAFFNSSRQGRSADAQFVLYERFASDVQRFFPSYDALPALANPLK